MENNNINNNNTSSSDMTTPNSSPDISLQEIICPNDDRQQQFKNNDIAIVGMGFRLPGGSKNPNELWNGLMEGFDGISSVPKDRWSKNFTEFGLTKTKLGGFLNDSEWKTFDPLFFGISPKEAPFIDPQQRILLTCAWEALEDAFIPPSELRGSNTGVFIGVSNQDFLKLQYKDHNDISPYSSTGTNSSIVANRVSYCFDFRGPSLAIDTACSSSLVSVYLASQAINQGDCDIALCGGVNYLVDPTTSVGFSSLGVLSEDGRCKPFSDKANGYVRSEGAGVLVIKSLSKAIDDGDRIYGVIKGGAMNEDGTFNKSSLTTPSSESQSNNILKALERSNLSKDDIYYVEAHGTGTAVGDPIEVSGISGALSVNDNELKIGSFKSNIGHLESAAGVASLIKVCLMLKNRTLVPTINCSTLNPNIPFEQYNISVVKKPELFPDDRLINIGINSFGYGGANCHLIIQEFLNESNDLVNSNSNNETFKYLIPFSTNSKQSMDKYLDLIKSNSMYHNSILFEEFVKHQIISKSHNLSNRTVSLCSNWSDFINNETNTIVRSTKQLDKSNSQSSIVFVFCGQGPQWKGMGLELYKTDNVFKDTVDKVDQLLSQYYGYSIFEKLSQTLDNSNEIHSPMLAQPSLFLLQVGLVELYKHWGIVPSVVVGHSFGEVTSAYASGIISLEVAVKIVYYRSLYQAKTIGSGRMLVVNMSSSKWNEKYSPLFPTVEIACYNSPDSIVVTDDNETLDQVAKQLSADGVFNTSLKSPCSFHSRHQKVIKQSVLESLADIESNSAASIPLFSTVDGNMHTKQYSANYVYKNLRKPVYFEKAIQNICKYLKEVSDSPIVFLEIAPHPTLNPLIAKSIPKGLKSEPLVLGSLNRTKDELNTFKLSIASMYTHGIEIDFTYQLYSAVLNNKSVVQDFTSNYWKDITNILPKYQWDLETYWNECLESKRSRLDGPSITLLGNQLSSYSVPTFETIINVNKPAFEHLVDHKVKGKSVFPGAGYIEIISQYFIQLQKSNNSTTGKDIVIESLEFMNPFVIVEGENQTLQSIFEPIAKDKYRVSFLLKDSTKSKDDLPTWTKTCKGVVSLYPHNTNISTIFDTDMVSSGNIIEKSNIYSHVSAKLGLQYGQAFQRVESLFVSSNHLNSVGILSTNNDKSVLNASILDNAFHGMLGMIDDKQDYVVESIEHLVISVNNLPLLCPKELKLLSKVSSKKVYSIQGKAQLLANEKVIASFGKITIKSISQKKRSNAKLVDIKVPNKETYAIDWQSKDCPIPSPSNIVLAPFVNEESFIASNILKDPMFCQYCSDILYENLCLVNSDFSLALKDSKSFIETNKINVESLHLERFFSRILEIFSLYPPKVESTITRQDVLNKYPQSLVELDLIEKVAKVIPKLILLGDSSAPHTLFEDDILSRFYSSSISTSFYLDKVSLLVKQAISSIANERRVFKILEIGAGTGSLSWKVLEQIHNTLVNAPIKEALIVEYNFTDVSLGFIPKDLQANMTARFPLINFKFSTLDLEKNVLEQGYMANHYDIVLMAYVVHAVSDLDKAISNIYNLLSSRGWLLFIEPKSDVVFSDAVFGCFSQWYQFNDSLRTNHCSITPNKWNETLVKHGFNNTKCIAGDSFDQSHTFIIHSQKQSISETIPTSNLFEKVLIVMDKTQAQRLQTHSNSQKLLKWMRDISTLFPKVEMIDTTSFTEEVHLAQQKIQDCSHILHLVGIDTLNSNYKSCNVELVKLIETLSLLKSKAKLLIVTKQAQKSPRNYINSSFIGIFRTAQNEHPNLDMYSFDIDCEENTSVNTLFNIGHMVPAKCVTDKEFILKKNISFVPRYFRYALPLTNNTFANDDQVFCNANASLNFKYQYKPNPSANNVVIRVMAVGINFKDHLFFKGQLPQDIFRKGDIHHPPFGLECSGIIESVGENVSEFKVGDQVLGFARHSLGSHVETSKDLIIKKPDNISFTDAASIPVVYCTAYYSLFKVGHLDAASESVLIHSATGGVGLASLNLLKSNGCSQVYCTVGSQEKQQYLESTYTNSNIIKGIYSTRDHLEFSHSLEHKVDCVLNTLAGDAINSNFHCLKSFGRLLDLSVTHIYANEPIGLGNFKRDILYSTIDLERMIDEKPVLLKNMLQSIVSDISSGTLDLIPVKSFNVGETKQAIDYLSERKHIGKVVVDCSDIFKVCPKPKNVGIPKPVYKLDIGACALITGQSGLSIPLIKWILTHSTETTDIIVASISSMKPALKALVEEYKNKIHFIKVDISHLDLFISAIKNLNNSIPAISSVFHLAAVYDDVPMSQVNIDNINNVHNPKANGALNLHRMSITLGWRLKNFILFSSITGLTGYNDQCAYNSANCILDSLAHFRKCSGLSAFVFNLGPMKGEGKVSSNKAIKTLFKNRGLPSLSLMKLFGALESVINNKDIPSQLMISPINFNDYLLNFSSMKVKMSHLFTPSANQLLEANNSLSSSSSSGFTVESLNKMVISKVSELLSISEAKIQPDHKLKEYGLDSLLTVQLKSWIDKEFEKNLFSHIQLASITVNSLVEKVLSKKSVGDSTAVKGEEQVISTTPIKESIPIIIKSNEPVSISSVEMSPLICPTAVLPISPREASSTSTPKLPKFINKLNMNFLESSPSTVSSTMSTPSLLSTTPRTNLTPRFSNSPRTPSGSYQSMNSPHSSTLVTPHINKNPYILGIGTAVPDKALSQEKLSEFISKDFSDEPQIQERVRKIFNQSQINTRHLVRDYTLPENSIKLRSKETITDVNDVFKKHAPALSKKACKKALKDWGGDIEDITHVMSVSSTGIVVPDINFKLIEALGLDKDVERISLNFMGCLAGLSSLRVASAIAAQSPKHRILVVCTELCSIHFSTTEGTDQIVASSIFADGSAAYVVGMQPTINERPLFEVLSSINRSVPKTEPAMTWDLTTQGWDLGLDASIPHVIGSGVDAFVKDLMAKAKHQTSNVSAKECEFLLHTGGKSIIMNIENSLGLDNKQTRYTWDIYKSYGNMSSASVIFVMDHARKQHDLPPYSVSLAFGPGLAFEGCVLKNIV